MNTIASSRSAADAARLPLMLGELRPARSRGSGQCGMAELAGILSALGERNEIPDIEVLRTQFAPRPALMPFVEVMLPATAVYDELLEAA